MSSWEWKDKYSRARAGKHYKGTLCTQAGVYLLNGKHFFTFTTFKTNHHMLWIFKYRLSFLLLFFLTWLPATMWLGKEISPNCNWLSGILRSWASTESSDQRHFSQFSVLLPDQTLMLCSPHFIHLSSLFEANILTIGFPCMQVNSVLKRTVGLGVGVDV